MLLRDVAEIRTGLVIKRKIAKDDDLSKIRYKSLNLKCVADEGYLDVEQTDDIEMRERLNPEYLTQKNDILIRLSRPYTAVYIEDETQCGYVIPSHFAIVRTDKSKAIPEYVFWFLQRDQVYHKIIQNISGSTSFGTISSGFFAGMEISELPITTQKLIGGYTLLAKKERRLMDELARERETLSKLTTSIAYERLKRGAKL